MKKRIIPLILLLLAAVSGIVSAQAQDPSQAAEPTQTPYIIYIVVTATPEPADESELQIQRPEETDAITLVNDQIADGTQTAAGQTSGGSSSIDDLINRVVATVMAQSSTTAGGTTTAQNTAPGAVVRQSDGTTCTFSFELVGEPSYPAGSIIPRGEIFWKEWLIRNTGSCTWTQDWEFVFDSGWQIGNTRFSMKRNTAPGQTLTVRLAMVPDQKENGNYYSTYAFEAPDGTRGGTITSSSAVMDRSSFSPTPTAVPYCPYPGCPWPWDPWDPCPPPGVWPCPPPW